MKHLLLVLLLNTGSLAIACQFDTDCSPGASCLKSGYSMYGVCAGGINPGNSNDRQPVYNQLNPQGHTGQTCSFSTDCSPGESCLKSGYAVYGVCR